MSNEKFVVSCFFVLLIALLSLAMLVYDITNPSNSFTVIRFTTRPALFFLPTAFLSSQFARGSSTSLRTLSGLVVGSRKFQSRFFSSKARAKFWNLQDIETILPTFQGNMLYFLSVVVEEYLDVQYLWAIMLSLAKYLNIQSL